MKKWIMVLFTALTLAACSKDDAEGENEPIVNETEVYTSQLVTVSFSDVLSESEYQGTFNGEAITLAKNDDNTLMFMVSASTPAGSHSLNIPALNTTINYNVHATVLNGTPDAVLSPFFSGINGVEQLLGESPRGAAFQSALDNFNQIYENSTPQQKEAFAVYYAANKELFDQILYPDFNNVSRTKSIDAETIEILAKHSYGVYLLAGGAIAALLAPGPEKPIAILVALAGAYVTLDQFDALMEKHLVSINADADGNLGMTDRTFNGISLANDVSKNVALKIVDRKITTADASSTNSDIVSFFKDYNRYNYYAGKLNSAIAWANDKIPFCNIGLLDLEVVPSDSTQEHTNITQEDFSHMTFSINHPNLSLASAQFGGDGQLKLKVNIVGTTQPVESFLNFTYADGLSTFSGKFNIKVEATENPFVGTWVMESFNDGYLAGEYQNLTAAPECPGIVYAQTTFNNMTFVFNPDNSWSISQQTTLIDFHMALGPNCTIFSDDPDTTHVDNDTNSGTYTYTDTSITTTDVITNNPYTQNVVFINENRIKMGTQIYNRQQ